MEVVDPCAAKLMITAGISLLDVLCIDFYCKYVEACLEKVIGTVIVRLLVVCVLHNCIHMTVVGVHTFLGM